MSKTLKNIVAHFFQIIWMILLCINFQCTLMLVDDCNFAQSNAWAYRAMYFNYAAVQVVHYFSKDENLLRSYM